MQTENLLQKFTFSPDNQIIRVEMDNNGEPWFVAKDVCNVLGMSDTEVALRKLDEDEKLIRKIYVSGQIRDMYTVNESGLYNLIFRSNKAEAKLFRKWVTSEVLPTLRKTGNYYTCKIPPPPARRNTVKQYPQNAEAEIKELLHLIEQYLSREDKINLSKEMGVGSYTVRKVLRGGIKSNRILQALYKRALENKQNGFVPVYLCPIKAIEKLIK